MAAHKCVIETFTTKPHLCARVQLIPLVFQVLVEEHVCDLDEVVSYRVRSQKLLVFGGIENF